MGMFSGIFASPSETHKATMNSFKAFGRPSTLHKNVNLVPFLKKDPDPSGFGFNEVKNARGGDAPHADPSNPYNAWNSAFRTQREDLRGMGQNQGAAVGLVGTAASVYGGGGRSAVTPTDKKINAQRNLASTSRASAGTASQPLTDQEAEYERGGAQQGFGAQGALIGASERREAFVGALGSSWLSKADPQVGYYKQF